jgi:hypothetical protein
VSTRSSAFARIPWDRWSPTLVPIMEEEDAVGQNTPSIILNRWAWTSQHGWMEGFKQPPCTLAGFDRTRGANELDSRMTFSQKHRKQSHWSPEKNEMCAVLRQFRYLCEWSPDTKKSWSLLLRFPRMSKITVSNLELFYNYNASVVKDYSFFQIEDNIFSVKTHYKLLVVLSIFTLPQL